MDNIIPTNIGEGYMSPMKAAYDIDVDIRLKRTFGCNCYMIIPAQHRFIHSSDNPNTFPLTPLGT